MMQSEISKKPIKRYYKGGNKIIHDKHEGNVSTILVDRAINSTEKKNIT